MTVGFMRWPDAIQAARGIAVTTGSDVIAPFLCKFALFPGELATTALQVEHQQIIIEPTYCARCRVRMR